MEDESNQVQRTKKVEQSDSDPNDAGLFEENDQPSYPSEQSEESDRPKKLIKKSKKQLKLRNKISKDKTHLKKTDKKLEKKKRHKRPVVINQRAAKNEEEERLDQICKKKATALLQNMRVRADNDIRKNKAGLSSVQKLEYLQTLTKDLATNATAEYFLQADGLQLFEKWLRKYPDGTEPSLTLKKGCFKILFALPVSQQALSKCQSLLTLIQKHQSSKQRELKELSEGIGFKWSCIMDDRYGYDSNSD